MPISAVKRDASVVGLEFDAHSLRLFLADGRELATPLEWFPRLRDASAEQRKNWRPIGKGEGIHWPDLDEDVSINALLGLPT